MVVPWLGLLLQGVPERWAADRPRAAPALLGRWAAANPLCCPSPAAAAGTPQCSSALLAQISFTGKTGYERRGRGAERASGSSWHGGDKHKHAHLHGSAPGSHALRTAPLLSPGTGGGDRAPKFGTYVLAWRQQCKHPLSSSLPAPQFWIIVSPVQAADDLKGAHPQFAKQHYCAHWAHQQSCSPTKEVQLPTIPHLKKFNKLAWGNQGLACSHARCHLFKVRVMPASVDNVQGGKKENPSFTWLFVVTPEE